jgi:hypothetical protein
MILDATSRRFEGKPKASAVTLSDAPFDKCASPVWWAETVDRDIRLTDRTMAYMVAYAALSAGSIPLRGLALADGFFRPDQYVMRALKEHRLVVIEGDAQPRFEFTENGWTALAEFLAREVK